MQQYNALYIAYTFTFQGLHNDVMDHMQIAVSSQQCDFDPLMNISKICYYTGNTYVYLRIKFVVI